jgi:hypothetical protein
MPINIPSNLYSGGRAVMDTTPFTNVILKDAAAKKAAVAAVTKNANDLYKGLNPAGVRPQDLQHPQDPSKGLLPDMVNWYNNAKAGNLDFGKYKELQANIERSKNIAKEQLEIGGLVQQGKIQPEKEDVEMLHQKDLSIYDTGHKDWKQGDLTVYVPDFNSDKFYGAIIGDAKPQINIKNKTYDPQTQQYVVKEEFTPDEYKRFGNIASASLVNDRSAQKEFNKQLANPVFLSQAIPVYESVYGKGSVPSVDAFTKEQAAASAAIMRAKQLEGIKTIAKPTDQYALAKYKSGLSRTGGGEGAIDEYIKNITGTKETLSVNGKPFTGVTIGGASYFGKLIQMTPDLTDRFTEYDKGLKSEKIPYGLLVSDDSKYVIPIYFKKDEEGNFVKTKGGVGFELDKTRYSKPLPMPQFRQVVGRLLGQTKSGNVSALDIADEGTEGTQTTYTSEGSKETKKRKYD